MALTPKFCRIAFGMDPWEVYKRERFLGNNRVDPCSKLLKRRLIDRWVGDNCIPLNTICYVGIDYTEIHRFDDGEGGGLYHRHLQDGWTYESPLCRAPIHSLRAPSEWLRNIGIERPLLTRKGFSHNNCSSHCCRAGQGHRAHQLRIHPERYAFDEANEEEMREFLGSDVSMMSETVKGKKKPLTMKTLRERIESGGQIEMFDIGGCGCFSG